MPANPGANPTYERLPGVESKSQKNPVLVRKTILIDRAEPRHIGNDNLSGMSRGLRCHNTPVAPMEYFADELRIVLLDRQSDASFKRRCRLNDGSAI